MYTKHVHTNKYKQNQYNINIYTKRSIRFEVNEHLVLIYISGRNNHVIGGRLRFSNSNAMVVSFI